MQHHGAPTRILDWSESPLVALYFAAENFEHQEDAAVWVLHPWMLNMATDGQLSVPTANAQKITDYVIDLDDPAVPRAPIAELPLAMRIEYGFNRAHSQRGTATIHGRSKRSIESIKFNLDQTEISNTSKNRFMFKIIIDRRNKFDILKSLYEYGVGADTLFPDLGGLAAAIRFRYDHRYLGEKLSKQ
jgi:hypothetical protein